MADFNKRDSWPKSTNSYYSVWFSDGYQCVSYARGRFCEILGLDVSTARTNGITGNGGDFFNNVKNKGVYKTNTGINPPLGAILCWTQAGKAGHVAVVEEYRNGVIYCSEGLPSASNHFGYNSCKVENGGLYVSWENKGSFTGYSYQGYIYTDKNEEFEGKGTIVDSGSDSGSDGQGGGGTTVENLNEVLDKIGYKKYTNLDDLKKDHPHYYDHYEILFSNGLIGKIDEDNPITEDQLTIMNVMYWSLNKHGAIDTKLEISHAEGDGGHGSGGHV